MKRGKLTPCYVIANPITTKAMIKLQAEVLKTLIGLEAATEYIIEIAEEMNAELEDV